MSDSASVSLGTARRLATEAAHWTGLDREWRECAAWKYWQHACDVPACEWTDEPDQEVMRFLRGEYSEDSA